MYDFVDRPVESLNKGGRLLVWAMRHWVRGASEGRCPCGDVGPVFHKWNLMAGFPHFHLMMALLNRHALDKLRFGAVEAEPVSEDEAILLSLIRVARDEEPGRMRDMAGRMVDQQAVPPLIIAFSALAQSLIDAGMRPLPPMFDIDRARFG